MKTGCYLSLVMLVSMSGLATNAQAGDWIIPAYPTCKVSEGKVASVYSGYTALKSYAIIDCPITKEVGKNLNGVYVRIYRNSAGGARDTSCMLRSDGPWDDVADLTFGKSQRIAGNQSISIPVGKTISTGTFSVSCTLSKHDIFYGIRYSQSD